MKEPTEDIKLVDVKEKEPDSIQVRNQPVLWRSCSGCSTDPRLLRFSSSLVISLIIIIFCIIQISLSNSCEETNTFMSLLMFVIGVWLPSPIK